MKKLLFIIPVLLSFAVGFNAFSSNSYLDKKNSNLQNQSIKIKTKNGESYKVKKKKKSWVYISNLNEVFRLIRGSAKYKMINKSGEVICNAQFKNNQLEFYKNNNLLMIATWDHNQLRVFNASKKLQYRIKMKSKKFNIYDSQGSRIMKGKPKKHGFSLYNLKGKRFKKIIGQIEMKEAVYFGLPIDFEVAALMWFSYRVKK